jgi:hypothetical protein
MVLVSKTMRTEGGTNLFGGCYCYAGTICDLCNDETGETDEVQCEDIFEEHCVYDVFLIMFVRGIEC